jgi:hypothetical protein
MVNKRALALLATLVAVVSLTASRPADAQYPYGYYPYYGHRPYYRPYYVPRYYLPPAYFLSLPALGLLLALCAAVRAVVGLRAIREQRGPGSVRL